jgi:hypothetical protein
VKADEKALRAWRGDPVTVDVAREHERMTKALHTALLAECRTTTDAKVAQAFARYEAWLESGKVYQDG